MMRKLLLSMILPLLASGGVSAQPIVSARVQQGAVQGYEQDGLGCFNAIPFAEAPTGNLRWKAPVPKKAWEGTLDAREFGAMPPQRAFSWPTWAWANLQQRTGSGKVYMYFFDQFDPAG